MYSVSEKGQEGKRGREKFFLEIFIPVYELCDFGKTDSKDGKTHSISEHVFDTLCLRCREISFLMRIVKHVVNLKVGFLARLRDDQFPTVLDHPVESQVLFRSVQIREIVRETLTVNRFSGGNSVPVKQVDARQCVIN